MKTPVRWARPFPPPQKNTHFPSPDFIRICRRHHSGWTLPELLVTGAIISVMTIAAIPSLNNWMSRNSEKALFEQLNQAAVFARTRAVRDRQYFTVCASEDQTRCSEQWQKQIIVFSDTNHNEVIDGTDQLLRSFTLPESAPCLEWRGSGRKNYLQFKPSGASNGTAGHFRLCEPHPHASHRRLVVSLGGRTSLRTQ